MAGGLGVEVGVEQALETGFVGEVTVGDALPRSILRGASPTRAGGLDDMTAAIASFLLPLLSFSFLPSFCQLDAYVVFIIISISVLCVDSARAGGDGVDVFNVAKDN